MSCPRQVWWVDLGSGTARRAAPREAHLLYHQPDERFHLRLWRSRSGGWASCCLCCGRCGSGSQCHTATCTPCCAPSRPDVSPPSSLSCRSITADALIYLQGSSETTQYLLYLSASASLGSAAPANFTVLVPAASERQMIVRDWPAPASSDEGGSSEGGSSEGSDSGSGEGDTSSEGGTGGAASEGSGASGFIYAIVYTAERRNGELVVASLRPDTLPGDARNASSSSGSGDTDITDPADSGSSSGGGSNSSSTSDDPHWALLQAHDMGVELVDLALSATHLAVLERRNGTLVATAYALPSNGAPQGLCLLDGQGGQARPGQARTANASACFPLICP